MQLIGLLTAAREQMKIVEACEKAGDAILKQEQGSLFGDAIYGGRDFDDVMKYLVKEVVPDPVV